MSLDWIRVRSFHFVGVGGVGMSGMAELLCSRGCRVSGSDVQEGPFLERLREKGVRVEIGHHQRHLKNAQAVVFSSAVAADNPELAAARERGLLLLHRGELLAELMSQAKGISVAGTHGKTTTTAMTAAVMMEGGLDPTVLVGARVDLIGGNCRVGAGPWLVAEADESDRSFLHLNPDCAVVTNIDLDHMDEYRDLEDLKMSFGRHLENTKPAGLVVACGEDVPLKGVLKKLHRRVVTYGLDPAADICAQRLELGWSQSSFDCWAEGNLLGRVELSVSGRHNVLNALAALAVGHCLVSLPFEAVAGGLRRFRGVQRRLQRKGEKDGVLVVDDYGHHPAEIRATLEACRMSGLRTVVLFQPHRYSRTENLMEELARSFDQADALYLMDVYPAGEKPIPGVDSGRLAERIGLRRSVSYLPGSEDIVSVLRKATRPGDLLLTLGAGDVWKVGEAFLN